MHEPVGQVQFVVWKIYKYLLQQIAGGIMLLLDNEHEKTLQKVKTDEILKACANYLYFALLLQLCTCVMTLHSRYMRMHSFSANQKRVIFFMCIINKVIFFYNTYPDSIRVKLLVWIQSTLLGFVFIEEIIYVP